MMNDIVKLPGWVRDMATLCDRDGSRYCLDHVRVEPEGDVVYVVATDGRVLGWAEFKVPSGLSAPLHVPAKVLRKVPAAANTIAIQGGLSGAPFRYRLRGMWYRLRGMKDLKVLADVDFEVSDGVFPSWRAIDTDHATKEGADIPTVAAEYLGKVGTLFTKASKAQGTTEAVQMACPVQGDGPVVFTARGLPLTVALMPMV
jgi:hypothetical protein